MKKILLPLIIFAILLSFKSVHATSGACSGHNGVNCSRGADSDGSVICNDGWRESTVRYSEMASCNSGSSNSSDYVNQGGMLDRDCSGLSSSDYPDFQALTMKKYQECLGQSCSGPNGCSDFSVYSNAISGCWSKASGQAYKEISTVCAELTKQKNIKNYNTQGGCPEFSQLFLDFPTCKEDDKMFPVKNGGCCVCYMDHRNYNKQCIPEMEYQKAITEDSLKKEKIITEDIPEQKRIESITSDEAMNDTIIFDNQKIDRPTASIDTAKPAEVPWYKKLSEYFTEKLNSIKSFFKNIFRD